MAGNRLRVTLPRHLLSGRTTRDHVRTYCATMPVCVSLTAELLTSELVANAVLHGEGHIELALCVEEDVLRVEVHDESPNEPHLVEVSAEDTAGRGLRLVNEYALEWGAIQHTKRPGKTVWFTLRV